VTSRSIWLRQLGSYSIQIAERDVAVLHLR
jgi:hypothetical protein